ncbi:membrane protein [Mesorhizobium tianshanense]|uniref:Putative membrane protein n=1 Tax=Mesorhizobium tianshanense TaxID=39844 RepID=A0A562P7J2_9HYPH|nr:putative membrane protein [Mesorhizobium tianshanense]GLS40518.1 membrane protein [Mesorhizobium tianshanense]
MAVEDFLRLVHLLGATVLFGTGAGIAFFMVMAVRTRDPRIIAHVAGIVVIADAVFTATAVVLQPLTGYGLARVIGWPLNEGWLILSLVLYVFIGLFWLPVVWIQIRLRDMASMQPPRRPPCHPASIGSIASGLLSALQPFSR